MAIFDLFSKRHKPLPDVYVYDKLPNPLRVQVVHILRDSIPAYSQTWGLVEHVLLREHALFELVARPPRAGGWQDRRDVVADVCNYFLALPDVLRAIDVVECAFRLLEADECVAAERAEQAVSDLNRRFQEHGCGYEYVEGRVVRIDSQLLHEEAVKPALGLLTTKGFEGPQNEFLLAHEHFRHGRIEDAVTNACKTFESVMKAICEARGWNQGKGTASSLINVLIGKQLVPEEARQHMNALDGCLIGLASIANEYGRHGAGDVRREVPEHYAAYALHLAATNIVFLLKCHVAKPK